MRTTIPVRSLDGLAKPVYTHAMHPNQLSDLLLQVQAGKLEVGAALEQLAELPFADLDFARVDHHRELRQGIPEVIFAQEKTVEHVIAIAREIIKKDSNLLITRLSPSKAEHVQRELPALRFNAIARTATYLANTSAGAIAAPKPKNPVLVVTAGTSDAAVAEEAGETLALCGVEYALLQDVGVAGLHRLLVEVPRLRAAPAIIVIAGMEGALASVLGGLVACPIVAVPTSVGYGVAFQGLTALCSMLTSCAAGVTVVNIDNGFGAAIAVVRMLRNVNG